MLAILGGLVQIVISLGVLGTVQGTVRACIMEQMPLCVSVIRRGMVTTVHCCLMELVVLVAAGMAPACGSIKKMRLAYATQNGEALIVLSLC